ncbi:Bardet-Biedl syndrome 7 protein homolog isoform X2 [Adelges cooleyi]|uniref:Bardet-Biedl syndrome 7 protein homolog isoform X2 n=1 Tax=Adelges cooleyi TaxID=133065 RepID=UPI00217F3879|nr:Bardet-Biedl syndrome 7 protein homolog isoform X2 [Adelges cooleyi]
MKVDYTLLGMVSSNCVKVIPTAQNDKTENKTQKIIVGDQEGILQLIQMRKGKVHMLFKTLPLEKITQVCLGGALGTVQDKIFVSMGSSVRGYTKKGQMFLSFDTGLTEPVKCMYVTGNELLVSGRHVFNHFSDCKDNSTYLCPETINSIVALDVIKMQGVMPILACADLCIRILEGSAVKKKFYLPSEPTYLHLMNNNGGSYGNEVLVGLQNGVIVLLKIEKNASVNTLWELNKETKQGTVTCMDCYNIDGEDHLLVGRQSGSVEVYSLDSNSVPIEKYKYICSESVTSIQGGSVRIHGVPEVVVSSFTGWLFGLTFVVQHVDKEVVLESSNIILNDDKQKIADIRTEVSDLERLVAIEREKYLEYTQKSSRISVLPQLAVKNTMLLDPENITYHLIIELEATIDNVLLQCNCLIHLIDVEANNTAVVSKSKCNEQDDNKLLITYRCQMNTTKLELKMWSHEGDHGILTVYITPLLQPKSCQVCTFPIKPLLYHQRTYKENNYQPHSFLTLTGGFSLAEAHAWISNCFPGIPDKPAAQENVEYTFVSSLIGTILHCTYSRGSITVKTDNITAISILKDNFSKEATRKNIILDMSYDISEISLTSVMTAIVSKLKVDTENDHRLKLVNAMKQLPVNANCGDETLSENYLKMIADEDRLKQEVSKRPCRLQRLRALTLSLFDDWHKLKGLNVKSDSRASLQHLLQTSNALDSAIDLFII